MSQDGKLQQAVLAELNWEPSVTAAHIGVTASAGVVTLTGHVDTFAEKHAAEAAAQRVKGVRAVAVDIEVQLPFDHQRGDDDIAAAALDRLAWDVSVPRNSIKVEVDHGWIVMTGEVDWYYQKEAAEQDLRRLTGVVGVSNQTTLKPRIDASTISDDIAHALNRSWFFDDNTIKVSADGGRIRLSGTARSPHERQVAAATAWAAPGATSVQNDIAVI
jgi:osmotically-inducible protein OsmY